MLWSLKEFRTHAPVKHRFWAYRGTLEVFIRNLSALKSYRSVQVRGVDLKTKIKCINSEFGFDCLSVWYLLPTQSRKDNEITCKAII